MRPQQIKEVIREAIKHPKDFPALFIWGGPGIGKSSVVKQSASEEGVGCIDIRALLLDPTDLRGIPIPEDGKAKWLPPSFLPTDGRWVIFFDELLLAPPLTTNSILQLTLDRRLGEYILPDECLIIAASNRETEAIGVYRLSPPLANRFIHITFDILDDSGHPFSDDAGIFNPDWVNWALQNDIHPAIIGLLSKFRPELIYKFDPNRKSFPTPRSWESVSKVLTNSDNLSESIKYELIKGAVGEGACIELQAYMKIWNQLPDLNSIMNGENIIPKSVDVMFATCTALVSKAQKVEHYSRLLDYTLALQREFTIFLFKLLLSKDSKKVQSANSWPKFAETVVSVEKLLI